jgi:hypothetical protein
LIFGIVFGAWDLNFGTCNFNYGCCCAPGLPAGRQAFRCIFLPSKKGKKDAASIPAPA